MGLPVLRKYQEEVRTETFDFTDKLADGDSLTGTATVSASPGITVSNVNRSGNIVSARFSGGTNGQDYTLTCLCDTTDGDHLKLAATLEVRADAN